MRYVWSRFLMIFVMGQVVAFAGYYYVGPQGLQSLWQLQELKQVTQAQIATMTAQNEQLEQEIQAWQTEPFLQEKFARERLGLQKEGEKIYYREL